MPRKIAKTTKRFHELHMSNKYPQQLAIGSPDGPILPEWIYTDIQLGTDVYVRGTVTIIDGWYWLIPNNGSFEHDRIHLLPGHRLLMIDHEEQLEGGE